MAEVSLFTDGTVAATEADIIKARSKLLKDDWLATTFTVGTYPLLKAIQQASDADGTFNVFADDDVNDGEFAITFKYSVATDKGDKEKLVMMMQLARKVGAARIINTTIGKVFITTQGATLWADLCEEMLGYL